jgi:hypothetical protein
MVSKQRTDSLLAHCLLRAAIVEEGGLQAVEKKHALGEQLSKWQALKVATKVTPTASRVAGFIVLWAVAMQDDRRDSYSITEYQRYWKESERQAYRLQRDFRELWPEFDTPDELARQIIEHLDRRVSKRDAMSLPMKLQVSA